jgi:putative MATE family efflux protein
MLVNATYNLADSLFVGWGAGTDAIGGLTMAFPIQMIVMAFALMIGIGGASVFSRAYGRNDQDSMYETTNTAVRLGLFLAIILTILGLVFLDDLLLFFGANPENIGYAQDYLGVILFGVSFQSISMILNNLTRAEGRAKVAMISMVLGTGLNIILDPIFIFDWGFGLGVQGAAIATVISQFVNFAFITYKTFDKDSVLTIAFHKFYHLNKTALFDIIKIGLPTFIRNALGAFLTIILLKLIDAYTITDSEQTVLVSVYGVINRVLMFILMPGFGLVQGLAPISGYNFGAKNWDRLVQVVKFATLILLVYFIFGFLLIQLGSPFIFDAFDPTNDPVFIETGTRLFRLVGLGLIFVSFQIIAGSIYQSFGYAKRALFISLSRQIIFFIPIAFILIQFYGIDGLWYTFALADTLSGIIGLMMLIHEIRDLQKRRDLALQ